VCSVYVSSMDTKNNTLIFKRKKILTSSDYTAKEFVSVAFQPQNEKSFLATLTGEPDWKIIIWMWDKSKCFSVQQVGVTTNNMQVRESVVNQCSFSNVDPNVILVTGNNTYKYYRLSENNFLKLIHG